MTAPIRILGVGSPWGDDRVGLLAVQALVDTFDLREVSVAFHDRPGAALIHLLQGARAVVLVDAVRSGAAPGALHRLEGEEILAGRNLASSHGFGLAEALALAEGLGEAPPRLVLWGVEIETSDLTDRLSPPVHAALPALIEAVAGEVRRLAFWVTSSRL